MGARCCWVSVACYDSIMREVLLSAKIRLSVWHTVLDFDLRGCPCVVAMLHGTLAVVPGQMVDCLCSVIASSLQD